jgi:hypothetical protein
LLATGIMGPGVRRNDEINRPFLDLASAAKNCDLERAGQFSGASSCPPR